MSAAQERLVLAAITEAGGTAGTGEITARVNRNRHVLPYNHIVKTLEWMSGKREALVMREDTIPVTWTITAAGRRFLARKEKA